MVNVKNGYGRNFLIPKKLAVEASRGKLDRVSILHVNAPEEARQLEQMLRAATPCPEEIIVAELTPGLSTHTGTGMVGVSFIAGH